MELLAAVDIAPSLKLGGGTVRHSTPLKRSETAAPAPHVTPPPACHTEYMLPQILIEDGGLSARSLRLFGVVRRFADGRAVSAYSGFATAPLTGFRMKGPADIGPTTAIVERAFVEAVRTLAVQASLNAKPL